VFTHLFVASDAAVPPHYDTLYTFVMLIKGPWNINKSESQLQRQQGTVRDYCGSAVREGDCSVNFEQQDRCVFRRW